MLYVTEPQSNPAQPNCSEKHLELDSQNMGERAIEEQQKQQQQQTHIRTVEKYESKERNIRFELELERASI